MGKWWLTWSRVGSLAVLLAVLTVVAGCAEQPATSGPANSDGAPGAAQRVEVHYAGGAVQGGVQRVSVQRGSAVALVVSSDVADEVHLHTYDRKVDVPAGGTATLNFTADQSGVFEAELESKGIQLVQFEVH